MPLYMDRHDAPGLSPEEVAEAHQRDLDVQERHAVQYHTYWFDPANGSVFCLAEGPSKDAVEAVHQEAHGAPAPTIIELDPTAPLNRFLGAAPVYPAGSPYVAPAMRAIVFTDLCGSVDQTARIGDEAHVGLLKLHNEIIRRELGAHDGHEVKHTGDGIMASFTSVVSAVSFSIAVQRAFREHNESSETLPMHVSIGVSVGEPVSDDSDDLFGAAVQLAARLCGHAGAGEIETSLAVRELCMGKQFRFGAGADVELKGLPEPVTVYRVAWSDQA